MLDRAFEWSAPVVRANGGQIRDGVLDGHWSCVICAKLVLDVRPGRSVNVVRAMMCASGIRMFGLVVVGHWQGVELSQMML